MNLHSSIKGGQARQEKVLERLSLRSIEQESEIVDINLRRAKS